MVVATGEFGRTPRLNCSGGRTTGPESGAQSWPEAALAAGLVIGDSDALAASPADGPGSAAELMATMYRILRASTRTCGLHDG